jgi:hypothetical protein
MTNSATDKHRENREGKARRLNNLVPFHLGQSVLRNAKGRYFQ